MNKMEEILILKNPEYTKNYLPNGNWKIFSTNTPEQD
jgi:hypothetical protein